MDLKIYGILKGRKLLIKSALILLIFSVVFLAGCVTGEKTERAYSIIISQQYTELGGLDLDAYTYNGSIPGPLLQAKKGEKKTFVFFNNLSVETTVHFHGIIPANANDGVPLITQESIAPGQYFSYNLTFPHSGLFWYHSHVDGYEQVERGLQAPFLVRELHPVINEESEAIVVIDDLLVSDGDWSPFSTRYMHGRMGNILTINGDNFQEIDIPTNVARLRFVNTANARNAVLNFGGKEVTVIGKDLEFGKPKNVSEVFIPPAGRVDLLVSGDENNPTQISLKIRNRLYKMATVHHGNGEAQIQLPLHDDFDALRDEFRAMPTKYQINMSGFRTWQGIQWAFNGKTYPHDPLVYSLTEGNYVFEIANTQRQPHPIHFHGMKFLVLERNGVPVKDNFWYDTVYIGGNEKVTIGVVIEDEGDWVYHCHILEHADSGMMGLLKVK